jgi:hypothetical protein
MPTHPAITQVIKRSLLPHIYSVKHTSVSGASGPRPSYVKIWVNIHIIHNQQNARLVQDTLWTLVEERIVKECSDNHAKNWAEDRTPEPILVPVVEDSATISYHGGKDARAQVTGRIKCCSSVHTETRTDGKEYKKYSNRKNPRRSRAVFLIREHENPSDEHSRAYKLYRAVSMHSIQG